MLRPGSKPKNLIDLPIYPTDPHFTFTPLPFLPLLCAVSDRAASKFPHLDADQTDRRVQRLYQRSRTPRCPLYVSHSPLFSVVHTEIDALQGDG